MQWEDLTMEQLADVFEGRAYFNPVRGYGRQAAYVKYMLWKTVNDHQPSWRQYRSWGSPEFEQFMRYGSVPAKPTIISQPPAQTKPINTVAYEEIQFTMI